MADRGGTLLVVRDVDGHVFGGFASTPWHVSPHYFGTGECFLFSASPAFRCWPWTGAPLPPSPLASRPSPLAFRPSLLDPILAPSAPAPPPSPVAPSGRDPPRNPSCPHPPPPAQAPTRTFSWASPTRSPLAAAASLRSGSTRPSSMAPLDAARPLATSRSARRPNSR